MGQYLAIGLTMRVVASIEDARDSLEGAELRAVVQQFLPDLGIFDEPTAPNRPRQLQMALRSDVWEKGLPNLLAALYPHLDRYATEQHARVIEELRATPPKCWEDLAKHGPAHFSCLKWEQPFPEFGTPDFPFRPRVRLNFDMVQLFREGKMIAECWRQSFRFLQRCMHGCFAQHELAKALRVYFTA